MSCGSDVRAAPAKAKPTDGPLSCAAECLFSKACCNLAALSVSCNAFQVAGSIPGQEQSISEVADLMQLGGKVGSVLGRVTNLAKCQRNHCNTESNLQVTFSFMLSKSSQNEYDADADAAHAIHHGHALWNLPIATR